MEDIFSSLFLNLLIISVTFSFVLMALLQKFKTLSFINKSWQIWVLNLIFSFLLGIPFAISFYKVSLNDAVWVGIFSFIGAPTIYKALKNQNIITYKPTSLKDHISIPKTNEIERKK